MKTLKKQLLSVDKLKTQSKDTLKELDSPLPISVKDLNLPKNISIEVSNIKINNYVKDTKD
jgi:hypothetical protein